MWGALRKDFSEFVSTVTEDAASALNQMDENLNLSDEELESIRRMGLEETYTTPLDEADEDVKEYMEAFDLEAKTDEIANLLAEHNVLKDLLEKLVPGNVTNPEFWQRYFFRCDVERIAIEWQNSSVEEEEGPINALGNLLGGAVKAVSQTLAEDDIGKENEGNGRGSFFQSGRPPFVMNTAVDDDDEDNEELGWDDDEDDADDEDLVVFKDEEKEKLEETLKQAWEERDQLQQTVHMQAKEIAALKEAHEGPGENDLRMKLFEMESELAAFKASQLDSSSDEVSNNASSAAALSQLQEQLKEKQGEVDKLSGEVSQLKEALVEHAQSPGSERDEDNRSSDLLAEVEKLREEKCALERSLEKTKSAMEVEINNLQSKLRGAADAATKGQVENSKLSATLACADGRIKQLEADLDAANARLGLPSPASPNVVSTFDPPRVEKTAPTQDEPDDWGEDWDDA